MNAKKLFKAAINQLGFDLHKLPKNETSALPLKVEGEAVFYQTALGDFYLPVSAPNDIVINCIKNGEMFEPEVVEMAKQFIRKGTAVLDVGSNFGQMAIAFSKLTAS